MKGAGQHLHAARHRAGLRAGVHLRGNRVEGGAGGSQSLTERGRCVRGSRGSVEPCVGTWGTYSRDGVARQDGGPTSRTLQRAFGGDGAWRPRDHRERTRQALGLAGVAAGLGAWPAWCGARAPTLRWTSSAASIRRRWFRGVVRGALLGYLRSLSEPTSGAGDRELLATLAREDAVLHFKARKAMVAGRAVTLKDVEHQ